MNGPSTSYQRHEREKAADAKKDELKQEATAKKTDAQKQNSLLEACRDRDEILWPGHGVSSRNDGGFLASCVHFAVNFAFFP
jgi:hypothetical protein